MGVFSFELSPEVPLLLEEQRSLAVLCDPDLTLVLPLQIGPDPDLCIDFLT